MNGFGKIGDDERRLGEDAIDAGEAYFLNNTTLANRNGFCFCSFFLVYKNSLYWSAFIHIIIATFMYFVLIDLKRRFHNYTTRLDIDHKTASDFTLVLKNIPNEIEEKRIREEVTKYHFISL
jgi:hypothetical protein